jgi:hypothetical protein
VGIEIKKQLIFLTLLVCSLIFASSEVNSYSMEIVNVKNISNDYVTEQTFLNIHETIQKTVNTSIVTEVAEDIFSLKNNPVDLQGDFYVIEGNQTLEMDSASGSIFYADYSKLYNVSYDADLPTPSECQSIVEGLLETKRDLFYNYVFQGFGSTNLTATNTDTFETLNKLLNIHVYFEFEIEGIPVGGPGGTSSVTVGNAGEIVGLSWIQRDTEPAFQVEQIPFTEVLERNGIVDYVNIKHKLVYYAEPRGIYQQYLCPMYEVELTQMYGDEEITHFHHFPATVFQPDCDITEPNHEQTFAHNDTVTFDCDVLGGLSPYTYKWESNIDGLLSTSKSFTLNEFDIEFKNDSEITHIITLTVTDDNDLVCEDSIEIIIKSETKAFGIELTGLILLGLIGFAIYSAKQKAGKKKQLLFIGLIVCSFIIVPISQVSFAHGLIKANQRFLVTEDTGDDGTWEIGCEYVKYSGDDYLPHSDDRAYDLYNGIGGLTSWTKKFIWGGNNAWEQDFKRSANGGTDYNWIDAVDLAYYTGHGNPNGFTFTSSHDDTWMDHSHASWGDQDLEWIFLDSCSVLRDENSGGETVFDRWGPALDGVHMVLGFHTGAHDKENRGSYLAFYLSDWDFGIIKFDALTVKDAWFAACKATEGSSVWTAVLYATQSNDPWSPQLNDPINDHIWGQGYVSSDPTSPKWWVWIATTC